MYVSDQTLFEILIIINILNINQTFFVWPNAFGILKH